MDKGKIIPMKSTDYIFSNNLIFKNLDIIIITMLFLIVLNTVFLIILLNKIKKSKSGHVSD